MPGERLSMRKIREVLRLRLGRGLAQRAIGHSLRLSQGAVHEYLKRAQRAGLGWPLPGGLDDVQLEAMLFPPAPDVAADQRPVPDWSAVHREMRRPNVTLALLWEEYRGSASDGFGYSSFCDLYREQVGHLKPTLRQVHTAGEKLFVDFAGRAMEVVDGATGEVRPAEIFVAVRGASSFIYAEATWSQTLPDWIAVHANALAAMGGVPRQIVGPILRQIQCAVDEGMAVAGDISREHADLAVRDVAGRTRVLTGHAAGRLALLQEAGLVEHQHCRLVRQMFDDIIAHDVAQRVGIPAPAAENGLLTPRSRITRRFRAHPPGLAPLIPQQPVQEQARARPNTVLREQRPHPRLHVAQRRRPELKRCLDRGSGHP
jgi:hypothetical protein